MRTSKLKSFRLQKGFSQHELAEKVGVAQNSIVYWESGRSMPNLIKAEKLAAILDISITEIIDHFKTVLSKEENENGAKSAGNVAN